MMHTPRSDRNLHRAVFLSLAAAGGLLRIVPAWLPLDWQLGHILSDDAFYYFTIARRLARFGLPSFDGLMPTNGFHPLWLSLITPVYTLPIGDDVALRLIVTFCGILDTVSLLLLIRILRSLHTGFGATATAAALYAFTPALLSHAGPLNGLETSLTVLLLFVLLGSYCAVLRNKPRWYASPGAVGAIMGLTVLARTDTIIIVALLGAALGLIRLPGRTRFALRTAATALVVLSPWLVWNLMTFGTLLQVSGEAYALSMSNLHDTASWGVMEYAVRFAGNCADVLRFFPVRLGTDTKLSYSFALQGALAAGIALLIIGSILRQPTLAGRALRRRFLLLCAPLAGGVLFILVHSFRTIALRGWYYAMVLPVLFLLLGGIVDYLDRGLRRRPRRVAIIAGFIVLPCLIAVSVVEHLHHGNGEGDKFAALPAVMETVPRGARIGSWNAGVFGYFLKERTVVNLDGLVNNAAYTHLTSRSLGMYCRRAGISYLVDEAGAFRIWDPFWSVQPGSMARSLRTIRSIGAQGSDTTMIIAAIRMRPFSGEEP
jgi:hypothetical protein